MAMALVFLTTGPEKFFENPSYLLGAPLVLLGVLGAVFILVAARPPALELQAQAPAALEAVAAEGALHLPGPSIWPLVLAVAVALSLLATVVHVVLAVLGLPLLAVALGGWFRQSRREYERLPAGPKATAAVIEAPAREHAIHLPRPSVWPLVLALAVALSLLATVVHFALAVVGVPLVVLAVGGWLREALREHRGLPAAEENREAPGVEEPVEEKAGPRAR
jgi:putative Mn2+ efflux pump MntP